MVHGSQITNGSITKEKVSFTTPSAANDPAIKSYVDDSINQAIFNQDWKASCRVASTANVNIVSAPSTLDGVTLANGNRVLLKNQTTPSENGIWVFASSGTALTRATDADNSSEVTPAMAVSIEEGTANARTSWRLTTTGTITVGTTGLTFELFSTLQAPTPITSNKDMTASATTTDFDQACATTVAATPAQDSYVRVYVNGVAVAVGDGVKTKDCYFSADSGTTAKTIANIASGDRLYWVGSVAGYQLQSSFKIDFDYVV